MSVIIKDNDSFDIALVSHIKDCQSNHIIIKNIAFRCDTIEDADGTIFVRQNTIQDKEES